MLLAGGAGKLGPAGLREGPGRSQPPAPGWRPEAEELRRAGAPLPGPTAGQQQVDTQRGGGWGAAAGARQLRWSL